MLLAERRAPQLLSQLDYNNETVTTCLYNLIYRDANRIVRRNDMPHILIYGPAGSGKRVRVMAFLRELYGPKINERVQETFRIPNVVSVGCHGGGQNGGYTKKSSGGNNTTYSNSIVSYSDNVLSTTLLSSEYHVEIVLDNRTYSHKDLIQAVLRYLATGRQVQFAYDDNNNDNAKNVTARQSYKYVFIHGIDCLAQDAQLALRRSMETLISYCRLIMTTQNLSNVNEALKSRCVCIRNPAPSDELVTRILTSIAQQRSKHIRTEDCRLIAKKSAGNMMQALLYLELLCWQTPINTIDNDMPPWKRFLESLLKTYVLQTGKETTTFKVHTIRKAFYELLSRGIDAKTLFEAVLDILIEIVEPVNSELCSSLIAMLNIYAYRSARGMDPIFHLEAWIQNSRLCVQKYH